MITFCKKGMVESYLKKLHSHLKQYNSNPENHTYVFFYKSQKNQKTVISDLRCGCMSGSQTGFLGYSVSGS